MSHIDSKAKGSQEDNDTPHSGASNFCYMYRTARVSFSREIIAVGSHAGSVQCLSLFLRTYELVAEVNDMLRCTASLDIVQRSAKVDAAGCVNAAIILG